jgi:LPS-assembly lipoprotein
MIKLTKLVFFQFAALGLISLGLSACGFQPLYSENTSGPSVQQHLQEVEVKVEPARLEQMVYSDLLSELTPLGAAPSPIYRLEVKLSEIKKGVGFEEDDSVTRFNFQLIGTYRLINIETSEVLYRSSSRSIAAYNVLTNQYATLTAERDAEKRASSDLASDIRLHLSLHFKVF